MRNVAIASSGLLCLLLMLFSHKLHGYKTKYPDYNTIHLQLKPTDSVTTASNFNSIKVIDLRKMKDTVGLHFSSHTIDRIISDSLPESIKALAAQIIEPASARQDRELLVVVKDLFITLRHPLGFIHFRVDFYLGHKDHYQLVSRMDSLYQFISAYDISKLSLEAMNDIATYAIIDCATKTLPADEAIMDVASIITEDKMAKSRQPVYSEKPKDGVYYSYNDFIANRPSDTDFSYQPYYYYDQRADRFFLPDKEHKYTKSLAGTACYAICYKGKWYKYFGGEDFKQMKMIDGDFVFLLVLPSSRSSKEFIKPAALSSKTEGDDKQGKSGKLRYNAKIYKMRIDAITGKSYKIEALPEYLNVKSASL